MPIYTIDFVTPIILLLLYYIYTQIPQAHPIKQVRSSFDFQAEIIVMSKKEPISAI